MKKDTNYLKDKYPDIFAQIDIERTLQEYPGLDINKLTCGSGKKIWFFCVKCKKSFKKETRYAIKSHCVCQICNHREISTGTTDLETFCKNNSEYRYILNEWDYSKNGISPKKVFPRSNKKYWFICNEGHSYDCCLNEKIRNKTHCPYCSNHRLMPGFNDFKTWCDNHKEYEYAINNWDYIKNGISPDHVLQGSNNYFYFKCSECGGIYRSSLSSLTNCPYCSHNKLLKGYNDLETWCRKNNREDILKDWDYEKNNIAPSEIMPGSKLKIYFKCSHGHIYKMHLFNKTGNMRGCPLCSNRHSIPELSIYEVCKKYFDNDSISGFKIDNKEIDIFVPSINTCVEYDGKRFHESNISQNRDNKKNNIILNCNYAVIRIKETDDETKLSLFKEHKLHNLTYYYIHNKYNENYFKRLSEIFEDIFSIKITISEIKNIFTKIKKQKVGIGNGN